MYYLLTVSDCHFESSAENGDGLSGGGSAGVTQIKVGHKKKLGNVCSITVLTNPFSSS
jgi:hypothetical protein